MIRGQAQLTVALLRVTPVPRDPTSSLGGSDLRHYGARADLSPLTPSGKKK